MTVPTALAALQDALRAELLAELAEELTALHDASDDQSYRDGVNDALTTLMDVVR